MAFRAGFVSGNSHRNVISCPALLNTCLVQAEIRSFMKTHGGRYSHLLWECSESSCTRSVPQLVLDIESLSQPGIHLDPSPLYDLPQTWFYCFWLRVFALLGHLGCSPCLSTRSNLHSSQAHEQFGSGRERSHFSCCCFSSLDSCYIQNGIWYSLSHIKVLIISSIIHQSSDCSICCWRSSLRSDCWPTAGS